MFKNLLRSALTILCLFFITSLLGQITKRDILTSTVPFKWNPPAGCKSFYVQLWGGGAGGNANWPTDTYFYNGSGGGGGGTFSESNIYIVTQQTQTTGYTYKVGTGGALNQNGNNSYFANCFAFEGKTRGNTRAKSPIGGEVKASYFGGFGGESWLPLFAKIAYHGGGGGSGRTNGEAAGGQTAGNAYHGYGGDGTGGGGMSGETGYPAGVPGGGGSGDQNGARGEIRVIYTCDYTVGSIGNTHTVPYPAELPAGTDFITNVASPTGFGYTYSWEDSIVGRSWTTVAGANQLTYAIPAIQQDTWYRRRINGCDANKNLSNIVKITVFRTVRLQSDGVISGKVVTDKSKSPVPGITITVTRTTPLKGSPASYTRTITTGDNGTYNLEGIFYGNPDITAGGDSINVYYIVTPSRQGHIFKPASDTFFLSSSSYQRANIDFTDTTVYSISGSVIQNCTTCTAPIFSYGIGNVKVSANTLGVFNAVSDSLTIGKIGNYTMIVIDPKIYTITPSYLNHQFEPKSQNINVSGDLTDIKFVDTTTRQISGKLTDMAGMIIGTGELVFQGIYQRKQDTPILTFRNVAPIQIDGSYTVRMPAGTYNVTINKFTCPFEQSDPRFILETDLKNFFNVNAIEPFINADTIDVVRNLVYHRRPFVVVTGLSDTLCNNSDNTKPGIIFKSNIRKYFKVDVFEGDSSLNNRVLTSNPNIVDSSAADKSDFLTIITNVTNRTASGNPAPLYFRLGNDSIKPMLDTFLIPGAPNTSFPFKKSFVVIYKDKYGREATPQIRNATVTGTFSPKSTYITSFPDKPYLILHAPPGDASYSFWSKGTTASTTTKYTVAKDSSSNEFLDISFGPTISITTGPVSFDAEIVAGLSDSRTRRSSSVTGKEEVTSITNNVTFETLKNDIFIQGNSGDVYVGAGKNYNVGSSITIDFDEKLPPGGCLIKEQSVMFLSPESYRTEFAYAEDHITNIIIPTQQKIADTATDRQKRKDALQQVSIWQQVIKNNQDQKKAAKFKLNRSFSYGVKIDESQTGTVSKTNSLTYNVSMDTSILSKFGIYLAGLGASGGSDVTISETQGYDASSTKETTTTMGYHLEDGDLGDYFSVDIKTDPVYGTPVFDLVAGTSSCPPEEGAQNRDVPQIISGDLQFDNLKVDSTFTFPILLTNKSESRETRFYMLSVDGTTSNGLIIGKNLLNDLTTTPVQYLLEYGQTLPVDIFVRKSNFANKTLSYSNVEFYLTDVCQVSNVFVPNSTSTVKITFNYASQCGGITLASPKEGWVANAANPNTVPVTMSGYVLNSIDSVTLEYVKLGSKIWNTGFIVKKDDLKNNPESFTRNWDISSLQDTVYKLRLKLVCLNEDMIYSNVESGVIDRKVPSLVGTPQPITKKYNPDGGEISFTYSELINDAILNTGVVEIIRRSNNLPVPISVRQENGKLIITPVNSLGYTADSFRVIVKNIADLNGNIKTKPDTSYFKLDFTPLVNYTGTNVAKVYVTPSSIAENSTGKMELHFKLKEKATKITKVYFNLSGSATFNTDFSISYDTIRRKVCDSGCINIANVAVLNQFSGYPGFVNIDSGKTEAIINIDPTQDAEIENSETITVTLANGPDYRLLDSLTATATILNFGSSCPPGNVLYVNRNAIGNNTGVNWQNAMTSLQSALASTCTGITQIWVAKGNYKPTINNSRDSSFVMKNNLAIYGGFAGTETQLSQRNWFTNKTILSGDIGTLNNSSDNAYNVLRNDNNGLNSTSIIDGFTITGGNANKGTFNGNRGGGVYNYLSTPSFYNCIITANNAVEYGGGMFNQGTAPLVVNSVFAGNTALYGGGIYNESAAPKIINSSFSGNLAYADGGAMATYGAVVPEITNSILWGNSSGIRNAGGSAPAITYSIVEGGYTGMGNLNTDPLFIFQPAPGLANVGDLRLQGCSPAINAGNNAALPVGISSDLAAFPRIVNTTIDMGAYERQSSVLSTIIYVDINATGNNSGESWANAYSNLGSAITELNFCGVGTTILVAKGTYFAPVNATYNLDKLNASVLGGYPTGGGITRNPVANPVVIRGNVQVLKSVKIDGIRVQKQ